MGSPPSRGAWIEIDEQERQALITGTSPPSRGAWIEISFTFSDFSGYSVAPLAGGVD